MLADSAYAWIAVQTPHFRFYYEANTYAAQHFAELRQGAEEARLHALEILGEKNYAPIIDLFYLDSREKMIPALGSQPTGWSEHQSNTVLLACNENLRPFHRHEIMHVLSMNLWKLPPLLESWLLEGLAVYADTPCAGYGLHEIAAHLQRENKLVSLHSLVLRFHKQTDLRAYMQSGSFVQFLYETYGREKFRRLWERGVTHLPQITGKGYRETEMEWREFLKKFVPTHAEVDWDKLIEEGIAMPAYVVVEIAVNDAERYERYKQLAPPSIAAYGGRYLARGGKTETLEGSWKPPRFVILEFPTAQQARAWWESSEYAPAKTLRQECAGTEMILVEGV